MKRPMPTACRRALAIAGLLLALPGCDTSRDRLLADLQSSRPHERAQAVRKLAERNRPEDLVIFTRAAKDLASIVRAEAAGALGKSDDPRVVDLLGELLADPDPMVQERAAMALALTQSEKARDYLTLQYGRRGRSTREAIVRALETADASDAMARVVETEAQGIWSRTLRTLDEGSLPEQVAAAEELGRSGRAEAISRLLPLTRDSQVILAAAAARGIGYAGDPVAVAALEDLLAENYPELRAATLEALTRLGAATALPQLTELALERSAVSPRAVEVIGGLPPDDEVAEALCSIARRGGDEEAHSAGLLMRERGGCPLRLFERALDNRWMRLNAMSGVIGLGPTASSLAPRVAALLEAADDRDLRIAALRALAALGEPSTAEAVRAELVRAEQALKEARADWVASPDDPRAGSASDDAAAADAEAPAEPAAEEGLSKQDALLARVARREEARLAELGKVTARPPVPHELVDDVAPEEGAELAAALTAAGALGGDWARAALVRHVEDPLPEVRSAALVGLIRRGGEGLELGAHGLLDPVRAVRVDVAAALGRAGAAGVAHLLELLPRFSGDRLFLLSALARAELDQAAVAPLMKVVGEGGVEAGVAAELLGRVGSAEGIGALTEHLARDALVGRRDALLALGRIGDGSAAEVVARDLYHDSPDIRAAAAEALVSLGGEAQIPPLQALERDYYRKVRESAGKAVARISDGNTGQ